MKRLLVIFAALLCMSGTVFAEDSYFPDFKTDTDMEISAPGNNLFNRGIQYGGWVTPVFLNINSSGTDLTYSINTLRLWVRSYLWNDASIYVRGKYTFTGTISEPTDTDHVFDLDIASLDMSFFDRRLSVKLGRKYFLVGSGLVLNNRGDGGEINFYSKYVNVQALASYTGLLFEDSNPYDFKSAEFADGADILFAGGTISGSYFNQTLYAILLAQLDFDSGDKLETQFWGGGLKGAIISGLTYYGEFVYQRGTRTASGVETDFTSMGAAVSFNYAVDVVAKPVVMLQYGYGSGDDTFVNYGSFNAGFGWNPTLSNLHAVRFGCSVAPTDMIEIFWLKRMNIIAKYSLYLVDDTDLSNVGVNTSNSGERMAGHGIDVSLRWKILSDLSFFANYGVYLPGDANSDITENQHFAMGGLNISF